MKILYIEDNELDARLLREYLPEGHTLFVESDFTKALVELEESDFHLVITDLNMISMATIGEETLNLVRSKVPEHTRVVGLSGCLYELKDVYNKYYLDEEMTEKIMSDAKEWNKLRGDYI